MVTLIEGNQNSSENIQVKQKVSKDIYVISQEIKIVKNLSCCDLKLREKQLRKLRKWLQIRSASSFDYSEDDLLRIWKGLFYCFWMSDKPLIQEDLAEEFGRLIECFGNIKTSLKFFDAFLKTMCAEWFGLDQWRLDKFLMLTRRMLRYTLLAIKKENWPENSIQDFNFYVAQSVLDNNVAGMIMHIVEIFLDELAKTSDGKIPATAVAEFTKPFIIYLAKQRDPKTLGEVRNKIFYHLLWQSDIGRENQEKFNAWKEMGFPNIRFEDLEKVEEADLENDEKINDNKTVLDPRAGNVDVFIPILPVDTKPIVDVFEKILENEIANAKSKKYILTIVDKYERFENGNFPLGIQKMPTARLEPFKPLFKKTVENLDELDHELHGVDRTLKRLNKKKRRKLLESLDLKDTDENNYDDVLQETMLKFEAKKNKILKSEISDSHTKKRKIKMEWIEEEIPIKNEKKENGKVLFNTEKKNLNQKRDKENRNLKKEYSNVMKTNIETKPDNLTQTIESEWNKPLEEGEIEYFVSSDKIRLNDANKKLNQHKSNDCIQDTNLVVNPYSKSNPLVTKKPKSVILGKQIKKQKSTLNMSLPEKKRVKIMLGKNMIQKPSEYIKQIRNSPQVPYDAHKKPKKSLLKPNQMPSPINPFYKKKIGLQLNDTF